MCPDPHLQNDDLPDLGFTDADFDELDFDEIDFDEINLMSLNLSEEEQDSELTVEELENFGWCLKICVKAVYNLYDDEYIYCNNCVKAQYNTVENHELHKTSCNCNYNLMKSLPYLHCNNCKVPVYTINTEINNCDCFQLYVIHGIKSYIYEDCFIPGLLTNLLCYETLSPSPVSTCSPS